ncbi:MAG: ABC transporter permease [Chloroflexi bacterium]|nr:ABC transporter permease [Chloroflexota bacterium]
MPSTPTSTLRSASQRIADEARGARGAHGGRSPLRAAWARLLEDRAAIAGLVVILLTVAAAIAAPVLTSYSPTDQDLRLRGQGPTMAHPLGMDGLGRDQLSRLMFGARYTIGAALVAVSVATLVGVLVGLISGYAGAQLDNLLMRTADAMLAFPFIVVAVFLAVLLGTGLNTAIVAAGIASVPGYARLVRSLTLAIREREYIQAAIAMGASGRRIAVRHVLPNALGPIVVYASLDMASAIFRLSSISFLGFGAQPPTPEWGAMLNAAQQWLSTAPHISVVPGTAIVVVVVAFNLVGDGLRDALDPRLKNK